MIRNLGPAEIVFLSAVLLLLFGPKKLPEFSRGVAQSIREIRNGFREPKKKEAEA